VASPNPAVPGPNLAFDPGLEPLSGACTVPLHQKVQSAYI
jgi:hypothetical protein